MKDYDSILWIYSWWACQPYESWRYHGNDPERPTENEALNNIAYQVMVAEKYRAILSKHSKELVEDGQ